jgi:hypothetical protein
MLANSFSLDAFATLSKATVSFIMSDGPSVLLHGTTMPQLDGFSGNFILRVFKNSSFFKILLENLALYMKANVLYIAS